jgi:V/A-type H+-transporting ATPase subunit E
MNNKIQELTDIIYNEGVAKGQAQADQILAQARKQAEKIISEARKQADSIVAAARKESADNAENVQKELRLYAAQAVEALKSEIATVVTDKIVQDSVKGFTADQKAFNEFMLRIAQEWGKNQQIEIKAQDADALTRYFTANAKALLDKGVKITQVNGQPAEFSIQPADGSYKVNFGTDEFMNWFKSMLRPQLVETLF